MGQGDLPPAFGILMLRMPTEAKNRLLERVAGGDTSAVHEVIAQYGDLIWSLARRFTGSDADAEEAVQDIFMTLWRKADRYDPDRGAEVTFVSVLARRVLIDRWRRSSRQVDGKALATLADTPASCSASAHSEHSPAEFDELVAAASTAFASLDESEQVVVRLSVELGLSHSAIAEIVGIPLGTVKTRIRTALRSIRSTLGQRDVSRAEP